ncbi:NfeD family protein [Microaerobacter geothermalis]|uniref:NfeD family protein n=1 Tax=Microaerobacter geothermalis TaxID=674972 RepID=UPI001F1FDDA4|nr:nodulation protein NfeD [Microaerobacter geothermalis]
MIGKRIEVEQRRREGNGMLKIERRRILLLLYSLFVITGLIPFSTSPASAAGELVYVIPVEQGVERGLQAFLERSFTEAEEAGADAIILEIDTLGGEVSAAWDIGELIRFSAIPVTAFIKDEAISAGTYIALNASTIAMAPGSTMGAAAPIDLAGNMADKKVVSTWTKKMVSAAELNGRNPLIAEGMVNPDVEIPGVTQKGELITLDAKEAKRLGYADTIASTREEVLAFIGLKDAEVVEEKLTTAEKLARIVTNPYVIPILFAIGLGGIIFELLAPGFGVPGIVGISAFALYFFGHYLAGFAGWEDIFLFIAGILLLVIEIFVPGFGIFGFLGIIAMITGLVMASYDTVYGLTSLGIATVVAFIVGFIIFKYFGHRGIWNRFILKDEQIRESGYVAPKDYQQLLGKDGISITPLRPAGTGEIAGERVDVVSEGGFISANRPIRVVLVEGTRLVVRERKEDG